MTRTLQRWSATSKTCQNEKGDYKSETHSESIEPHKSSLDTIAFGHSLSELERGHKIELFPFVSYRHFAVQRKGAYRVSENQDFIRKLRAVEVTVISLDGAYGPEGAEVQVNRERGADCTIMRISTPGEIAWLGKETHTCERCCESHQRYR